MSCLFYFSVDHYNVLVSTPDYMFCVVYFCDEVIVTADRCNSGMDEIQAQSTECPEHVRSVDWTRLLCIQIWCLWWFVDGTNVVCLFDLHVCFMCVQCTVFCSIFEEIESLRKVRLAKPHFATKQ